MTLRAAGLLLNLRKPSSRLMYPAVRRSLSGTSSDKVVVVEDMKSYEQHLRDAERAVVYFTATWCPPCRAIKPIYSELSNQYKDVTFLKVDVDQNEEAAARAGIRSVPAFHFFRRGKLVNKFVGADRKQLVEQIEDLKERP